MGSDAAGEPVFRECLTHPVRDDDRDRDIAGAHQALGGGAIQRRPRSGLIRRHPRPQALLAPESLDQPRTDLGMILVDHGNPDPRGGRVSLSAEYGRKDREKDNRQDEGQRLRDAIAAQVDPCNAQERAHYSRNSLPVR